MTGVQDRRGRLTFKFAAGGTRPPGPAFARLDKDVRPTSPSTSPSPLLEDGARPPRALRGRFACFKAVAKLLRRLVTRQGRDQLKTAALNACQTVLLNIAERVAALEDALAAHETAMTKARLTNNPRAYSAAQIQAVQTRKSLDHAIAQRHAVQQQMNVLHATASNDEVLKSMKQVNTAMRRFGLGTSMRHAEQFTATTADAAACLEELAEEFMADVPPDEFDVFEPMGSTSPAAAAVAATSRTATHASVAIQTVDTDTDALAAASSLAALAATLPPPPQGPVRRGTEETNEEEHHDGAVPGNVEIL